MILGLSTWDLGSGSDADWGSGFKDNFASTRLCCVTMLQARALIQSSGVMRVVCVPCDAHERPSWIQIGNMDPINLVSVFVWRAPTNTVKTDTYIAPKQKWVLFYIISNNKLNITSRDWYPNTSKCHFSPRQNNS